MVLSLLAAYFVVKFSNSFVAFLFCYCLPLGFGIGLGTTSPMLVEEKFGEPNFRVLSEMRMTKFSPKSCFFFKKLFENQFFFTRNSQNFVLGVTQLDAQQ